MGEAVLAALVTGVLSLAGVLVTLVSRRAEAGEVRRLHAELGEAQAALAQLRGEAERYRAAYLGLLEVTQGLLEGSDEPLTGGRERSV